MPETPTPETGSQDGTLEPTTQPKEEQTGINFENPQKDYRLAAKSVFLTYPKCYLDKDALIRGIEKLGFEQYYVVLEQHKDNTPHYHVLREWSTKKNIKGARHFDIDGYYPNISKTKNRLAAWRYFHKADNRLTHIGGDIEMPRSIKKDLKDDF